MESTELILKEIAGTFATGVHVYFNIHTLEIISVSDEDISDAEILENCEDYYKTLRDKIVCENLKMDSRKNYQPMADYVDSLPAGCLAKKLTLAIEDSKSFAN